MLHTELDCTHHHDCTEKTSSKPCRPELPIGVSALIFKKKSHSPQKQTLETIFTCQKQGKAKSTSIYTNLSLHSYPKVSFN